MTENNNNNNGKKILAATPFAVGAGLSIKSTINKGYFSAPGSSSLSSALSGFRKAGLPSNKGMDLSFFGDNQALFKSQPELARTAWMQAVQSTDPMSSEVLSFAGDIKTMPANKVIPSIEQTLQRNNSIFMARMYNKFKSNTSALRKHYEITKKLPNFKKVEGLSFPAARNMSINQLPEEIAAFHRTLTKEGIAGAGVKYYSRPGWEGFGTYVLSFAQGKNAFQVTVPVSSGGTLVEGLTQSSRRVAQDVGVIDPMSGEIQKMSRHAFYLRDIEQSILPRIKSGAYSSGWQINRAISESYQRNISSLESIPNLPNRQLSTAWQNYAKIKGKGLDLVTEGKLSDLRPGEIYHSVYGPATEEQFKTALSRSDLFPFSSPSNLAKRRVSSFDASEWFMTPQDLDYTGQPRQALRQWRASDSAVAEMLTSGSSKWSIFETQAWRRDYGNYSAPWVPTIYVDPVKHGAVLEQLGMKEGEALISSTLNNQLGIVGQPFPVHLSSVSEGVAERIKSKSVFKPGEIIGATPEGKQVLYEEGMKLLGLEPFETAGKGQEFALTYQKELATEASAKRFGSIKAVEKLTDPSRLARGIAEMTKDLSLSEQYEFNRLQGNVRIANMDSLKYQQRMNTQIITGLWEMIDRRNKNSAYKRGSKVASFLRNPRVFSNYMRDKSSTSAEFLKTMEKFAVQEAGVSEGQFWSVFGGKTSGLSFGLSQGIFHDPMEMTGAGKLGSVEPRIFDIFKGGQYGDLGSEMSTELTSRLAATNPEKLLAYEGLTKTLASTVGNVGVPKGAAVWDVAAKGYTKEGFQNFIESGGGYLKLGSGKGNVFVPGGDVLTPHVIPSGEKITGDIAMEYHNLTRGMADLYKEGKRINLQAAGELLDNFIGNIAKQQAPFGRGAGSIGRGQVLGSRFLRAVSEAGGVKPPGVGTSVIPQYIGEQMFEEMANLPGADIEGIQKMNARFLEGKPVGGLLWRHPLAGPYSAVPTDFVLGKGISEPVIAIPSKMVDIGLKNPIELSSAIGMGADRDADILSAMFVSPDLEKNIRKNFTTADNEYTRAYMEHQVRAQIIKTKAAGGAELLAAQERKVAAALKLSTGQEWIGKLSLQFSAARKAATQRLSGQRAADVNFTLNWMEESILKSKQLSGQQVLSGEMSALLRTAESALESKDAGRWESTVRSMLANSDETSRALLDQEVRIPKNVEAIREITGVKSVRNVLPSINITETSKDMMEAMEWSDSEGLEEMARTASGRKTVTAQNLGKHLSYTGSIVSGTKGLFAGVSEGAMRAKNFMASMGAGLIENKRALGWGFVGSLAIATALSRPQETLGSGSELVPESKRMSKPSKAAMRMRPADILPPEQPMGEPTVSPLTTIPTARITPGAEMTNVNISARSRTRLNTDEIVQKYRNRIPSRRMNINVRDDTSRLNRYDIADKLLK